MSTPNKRRIFSLEKKKEIIDAAEKEKNQRKLARDFKIPESSLRNILKDKAVILKAIANGKDGKRLRLTAGRNEELEEALLQWFKQVRSENVPVSGDLFKEKALEIARKLKIEGFSASKGWMENCKHRFGIHFKEEHGEAGAVDVESLAEWQQRVLFDELAKFSPHDVFNADETGLFWQLLPNKTLALKGEKCAGGKKSKERITVLVGANMSGTEKLPLMVIGKSSRPRCFKNAKVPVEYQANKKAWMTGAFFESWLLALDKEMKKQRRHILLYLDNCSSHSSKVILHNVTVKFLPPNTTSKSQPMDQGIIKNLKVHYRRRLLRERVKAIDEKKNYKINLLNALHLLRRSWDDVKEETIKNCFKHAKFVISEIGIEQLMAVEVNDETNNEATMQDLVEAWNKLQIAGEIEAEIDLEEYVDVDDDVITGGTLSINEILEKFATVDNVEVVIEEEEMEDEAVAIEEEEMVSSLDAMRALRTLRQYMERNFSNPAILRHSDALDDVLYEDRQKNQKQSKISDFFAPVL